MNNAPGAEPVPTSPAERMALLERCMAALAAGDPAAVFTLAAHFGAPIERAVRRTLTDMGRRDVLAVRAEVEGLVYDACFVIADRARGWRPGGAAPWTWTHLPIRAAVGRAIGHRIATDLDSVDAEVSAGAGAVDLTADAAEADLRHLASRNSTIPLLVEAVEASLPARDVPVYLEYETQKHLGDRSPAETLARALGRNPDAIRQTISRARRKVNARVAAEPRYADLRHLPWLTA